jgi:predicted cobalt transporter CbtA
MSPETIAWLAATVLALAIALAVLAHRHRLPARTAVTAACLVCTHTDTREDVRAATTAGNMHGEKTGHPLVLVQGRISNWGN